MRVAVSVVLGLCLVLAWLPVRRVLDARGVLVELSAAPAPDAPALLEQDVAIAGRTGPVRARLYRRTDRARGPGVVVGHGVHWKGIDEPRLVRFSRALAHAGRVVLTPELADLADYRITPSGVGVIKDSVEYLGARPEVASPRVGLIGFSFAGGQALVAAAAPELRDRLAFVTSVGGYHDLGRVLRFLVSDQDETLAGVVHREAHEYGLVVMLYGDLERFVPADDLGPLRAALRAWLHEDFETARALATQRRTLAGEELFFRVDHHRLRALAPELSSSIARRAAELAALSPRGHLLDIPAPVYLLHGSGDTVIPPSEAEWADRELGTREHDLLVTPLLEHVSVSEKSTFREEIALLELMSHMM